jgi:hypothetical protein
MSSEQDRVREVAERVARRLAEGREDAAARGEEDGGELAALRTSLSQIQRRLAHIESHLADGGRGQGARHGAQTAPRPEAARGNNSTDGPPWLSGAYVPASAHPSQERFANLGEAVAELVDFFESEKTCTVEPGEKPCDHCGLCSSRGF